MAYAAHIHHRTGLAGTPIFPKKLEFPFGIGKTEKTGKLVEDHIKNPKTVKKCKKVTKCHFFGHFSAVFPKQTRNPSRTRTQKTPESRVFYGQTPWVSPLA